YRAYDGAAYSSPVTVTINVGSVNDAPVANDDALTMAEDSGPRTINVLANDSDIDGDPLTITAISPAGHGTVFIAGGTSVSYRPNVNFNGSDSFTYTISDEHGGTASATVTVTVTPVNDGPIAHDDNYNVAEDDSLSVA